MSIVNELIDNEEKYFKISEVWDKILDKYGSSFQKIEEDLGVVL